VAPKFRPASGVVVGRSAFDDDLAVGDELDEAASKADPINDRESGVDVL